MSRGFISLPIEFNNWNNQFVETPLFPLSVEAGVSGNDMCVVY